MTWTAEGTIEALAAEAYRQFERVDTPETTLYRPREDAAGWVVSMARQIAHTDDWAYDGLHSILGNIADGYITDESNIAEHTEAMTDSHNMSLYRWLCDYEHAAYTNDALSELEFSDVADVIKYGQWLMLQGMATETLEALRAELRQREESAAEDAEDAQVSDI